MTLTTGVENGKTYIEAKQSGGWAFSAEHRFVITYPNGEVETLGYQGTNVTISWKIYIADHVTRFISPYASSSTGSVTVTLQKRDVFFVKYDWEDNTTKTINYTIRAGDVGTTVSILDVAPSPCLLSLNDLYVKSKNGVSVTCSGTSVHSQVSRIYWYTSLDATQRSSGTTSEVFKNCGNVTITAVVIDSRGITATATTTINVKEYYLPSISPISGEVTVIARRVDEKGVASNVGEYIELKAKKSYAPVDGYNTCILEYCVKSNADNEWSDYIKINPSSSVAEDELSKTIDGTYSKELAYYVKMRVTDSLGESAIVILSIPSEKVYMDRSGSRNSIAFGGHVIQNDSLEVYLDTRLYGKLIIKGEDAELYSLSIKDGTISVTKIY